MPPSYPTNTSRKIVSTFSTDPEIRDIVVEFVDEMPLRIQQANEAFMRGDRLRLQFWAHQLKGGATGYGFAVITKEAEELESAIQSDESTERIFAALLRVVDLCERVSSE